MPGDRALLEEFIARQLAATAEERVVADLVREIFKAMTLAGEAGSLLKIEEQIGGAVEAARQRYEQALLQQRKEANYLPGLAPERDTTLLDLLDLPRPEEFWAEAEERIYKALRAYAAHAEDGAGYRRRLFADDAERGFAFIDLCRKRYDVVLMNPPFGSPSLQIELYVQKEYLLVQYEVYGQFLARAVLLAPKGYVGAITSRAFLYLTNFLNIRNFVYPSLSIFFDLGGGVLDGAAVEVCVFVLGPGRKNHYTYCIDMRSRLVPIMSKDDIAAYVTDNFNQITFDTNLLTNFPAKPFCYNAPANVLRMFGSRWTIESVTKGLARVGLATGDNDRFVRCYWEIPAGELGKRWQWYAKGGEYLPYKPDVHLVVDWRKSGRLIEASFEGARIKKEDVYLRPAVTYSLRSQKGLSFRVLPEMCICSNKGPVIIAPGYEHAVLALANSSAYKYLVEIQSAFSAYEVGTIQRAPVPIVFGEIKDNLTHLAKNVLNQYMILSQLDETDVSFNFGVSIQQNDRIEHLASDLRTAIQRSRSNIVENLKHIDQEILSAYGWSPEHAPEDEYDKMLEMFITENVLSLTCHLIISLCFGVAIGSREVNVFKLNNTVLEPYKSLTTDRRVHFGELENTDGVIVDDEGHREDIEGRVREALRVAWGERADAIEGEACEILGVRSLREYFRKPASFFADHLQRYSKSRRQAPIYWPLATASGSYTLWLYYHRLTDQTLYTCVNDFIDPKLRQVAEEVARLRQKSGRSRAEERDLERLSDLEGELRDLRAELLRVAAFWRPNLNDGVQITAAPLWRLFGHKPWQKRLKETWESLERGDYDWAHLSYSIWPNRVRAKCVTDKSLAIAHDLEELYVEPPVMAKKKGRGKKAVGEEKLFESE